MTRRKPFLPGEDIVQSCGATLQVNMRDIETWKEDDGFEGALLSP